MNAENIVNDFYSLPPEYRTKDKLKQMLVALESKEKPTAPASQGFYLNREAVLLAMRQELNLTADDVDKVYKAVQNMAGFMVLPRPSSQTDVVLWEGLAKVGEPDFAVFKGRGDSESVCLVPVPYKLIKGHKGQIVFRKLEAK